MAANSRAGPATLPVLFAALALVVAASFCSPPALCAPQAGKAALAYVEPSPDDLLLVAVQLDSVMLSSDLDGYLSKDGILLPLGEMCSILELGVTVNPRAGTASGTLASPSETFSLDLAAQQVSVGQKPLPYKPELIQLHRNDIYVDIRLLSQWLPLDLNFNKSEAMLRMHAREVFPMQSRMQRERHGARAGLLPGMKDNGFEFIANPYKLFGFSAVDQRLTVSFGPSGHGRNSTLDFSTMAAGDLLGMGATALVFNNGIDHSAQTRLTLSRFDPGGSLLGGLGARQLSFGDVYSPAHPLLFRSTPGMGFVVSSYPLNQQDQFDAHTFQGSALPGWDVELYRNEVLIDYKPASDDGRYEFKDVPLLFGLNTFKLVLYGPHGERRQEVHRFNVGQSLISRGKYYYRMAMENPDAGAGLRGGNRFIWQNDYGLRSDLSVSTTVSSLRLGDSDHGYLSVGLRAYLGGVFLQSDSAFERSGGCANELALQTMLGKVSLGLRHTRLDNFASEIYLPNSDCLTSRTALRLDGISLPARLNLSQMSLGIETEQYASGTKVTRFTDRISANVRGLRLSHYMDYEKYSGPGSFRQILASRTLVVSKRFRHTEIRGEARFDLSPTSAPTDFLLNVQRDFPHGRVANVGILRSATGLTSVVASYTRNQGSCGLGYTFRYDSPGGMFAGLNLFFGVGREPRTGEVHTDANSLTQTGSAWLRAYLDTNQNGKLDPGEKLLEGVKFAVNDTVGPAKTDSQGMALVMGLQAHQPVDISVAESSLEDPLWVSEKKGYRFVPRLGNALALDVPIIATGEISGTVRLSENGVLREFPGAKLEMLDSKSNVVMTARSDYDGYYVFSKVPPGKYKLRISEEQAANAGVSAPVREVEVPPTGSYVDGIDIAMSSGELPSETVSQPKPPAPASVGGG